VSGARPGPPNRPEGRGEAGSGRRLSISPIGFDCVLALSQAGVGLRLAELAHAIGSPVSSVQTVLRILLANGLVVRIEDDPPRYLLSGTHPAVNELAALATVLAEPERAMGIVLRANPAVTYAGVDGAGFIVAVDEANPAATAALERHLGLVAAARPTTPSVLRMSAPEFRRMLRVSIGVRARVGDAIALRGSPTGTPTGAQSDRSVRRAAG
jgi:hypothetical protein